MGKELEALLQTELNMEALLPVLKIISHLVKYRGRM